MTRKRDKQPLSVKILLKKPGKPPEFAYIAFPPGKKYYAEEHAKTAVRDVLEIRAPQIPTQSCDYNSQIKMYYADDGTYNFEIGYQKFAGNVIFMRVKTVREYKMFSPSSLTDNDVKHINALMGWHFAEENEYVG